MTATKCPECGAGIPADYPACAYCRAPVGRGAGGSPAGAHRWRLDPDAPRPRFGRQRAPIGFWQRLAANDPFYAFAIIGLAIGVVLGIGVVAHTFHQDRGVPIAAAAAVSLTLVIVLALVRRRRRKDDDQPE